MADRKPTLNIQQRRRRVREVFEKRKFKLSNEKDKADEFQHQSGHYLYFYWPTKELDIRIDPTIEYSRLLKLDGVGQEGPHPDGLCGGTAMTKFPKSYKSLVPKDSHVGRRFLLLEDVLPAFLDHMISIYLPQIVENDGSFARDQMPIAGDRKKRIEGLRNDVDNALRQIMVEYGNKPGEDVDAIVKRRIGQGPFRNLLEEVHGVTCCVSGITKRRLLVASHIVPWSRASPIQKTDHENGLLLSVIWDALFDKGFISFDDHGKLLCSEELDNATAERLGISTEAKLPEEMLTKRRKENLSWHRREYGFLP